MKKVFLALALIVFSSPAYSKNTIDGNSIICPCSDPACPNKKGAVPYVYEFSNGSVSAYVIQGYEIVKTYSQDYELVDTRFISWTHLNRVYSVDRRTLIISSNLFRITSAESNCILAPKGGAFKPLQKVIDQAKTKKKL